MERFRLFSLVTYLSNDDIISICSNISNIRHYAFIYHDKDINDNNLPIEPHYHLLLRLENACTVSAVRKYFPFKPNTFVEVIKCDNIYNYLTHDGFEDKIQYSPDSIVSDDIKYWEKLSLTDNSNQRTVDLITDLLNGVDLFTMLSTYGRDFVINYDKYMKFSRLLPNPNNPPLSDDELNSNALRCTDNTQIAKAFEQMEVLQKKR